MRFSRTEVAPSKPSSPESENRTLGIATFVTSIGDWLSYFALTYYLYETTQSVAIAAYTVPMRSLAVAFGGASSPGLLSKFTLRQVLVVSQALSGLLLLALAGSIYSGRSLGPLELLSAAFLSTLLKQYFDISRESYSKFLATPAQQRGFQAELLQGLYSAQFVGPLLAVVSIRSFPLYLPLLVDAISFLVTSAMCVSLCANQRISTASIFGPLRYLFRTPGLREIFLIRSVGYWIPISIFNYLLFAVVTEKFGIGIENTAYVYAFTGLGSFAAATWLRSKRLWLSGLMASWTDAKIACGALLCLSVTRIAFLKANSFELAVLVVALAGLCNGFNAVTTQSLRRKFATPAQFPEVVGLELVVGKFMDWVIGTLTAGALLYFGFSYEIGVWISAALLVPLALAHLNGKIRDQ